MLEFLSYDRGQNIRCMRHEYWIPLYIIRDHTNSAGYYMFEIPLPTSFPVRSSGLYFPWVNNLNLNYGKNKKKIEVIVSIVWIIYLSERS